jgi:hypothetical protein
MDNVYPRFCGNLTIHYRAQFVFDTPKAVRENFNI